MFNSFDSFARAVGPAFGHVAMNRPQPARPLARIIDGDPLLAGWERRRRADAEATALVRSVLPRPLAALVDAEIQPAGQVLIRTPTGTIAAAVRQRQASISAALANGGIQCREVRVRVQPGGDRQPPAKLPPRQWDRRGLDALAETAARLPDGRLKGAIQRLLRRAGR